MIIIIVHPYQQKICNKQDTAYNEHYCNTKYTTKKNKKESTKQKLMKENNNFNFETSHHSIHSLCIYISIQIYNV